MNRKLFYNAYIRVRGFFNGSDFEAKGMPGADELAVLEPLRAKLPSKVFNDEVPQPPSTNPPGSLRGNLRKAKDLLAAAGWTYRNAALRNARGEQEKHAVQFCHSGHVAVERGFPAHRFGQVGRSQDGAAATLGPANQPRRLIATDEAFQVAEWRRLNLRDVGEAPFGEAFRRLRADPGKCGQGEAGSEAALPARPTVRSARGDR